ncbi:MAG: DUF4855 domain-containing protein [Bacillota bacterium]
MRYNVSLPPLPGSGGLAWKEREQPAIIIDTETSDHISSVRAGFARDRRTDPPDAVLYHTRSGKYRVYGLTNYDNCSGAMTFYSKNFNTRPRELSKVIPHGAGAKSLSYMPNEKSVLVLNNGSLYKIDRYDAKVKMAVSMAARAVFAGRNIYALKGGIIKEYSPGGNLLRTIHPAVRWAATINSGAVNYSENSIFVCSETGRMALISMDNGRRLAEGIFNAGGHAGFTLVGYNGEFLIAAGAGTKKIYWLDANFMEVDEIDYSSALPCPDAVLFSFDGRDILALESSGGTLYTLNIQDNWEYAGVVHTASPKPRPKLPPKLLDIDNIYILYCEHNWDKDRIKSVIGYLDGNKKATDIMYDGLLMMAQAHNGKSLMGDKPAAGPPEWDWYLENLMGAGGRYQMADLAAGEIMAEAGKPGFRPKVFIGLPYPMDSFERYRWFMDQCITRAAAHCNIVLAGFYHTEEFNPGRVCKKIKKYIHGHGLKYIWSPGYPARINIVRNKKLFDAIFYQTGYPWGYFRSSRGKEYQLSRAMANIIKFNIYPNVESMNDTRWFSFTRDKIYTLWDILLNYGVYNTTKLHFCGSSQVPDSCFSPNPFERRLYDLHHEFLRGLRTPGMAKPLYNGETDYSLALPRGINADKIRIMPRFTRTPPCRKGRTLMLKTFDIITGGPELT